MGSTGSDYSVGYRAAGFSGSNGEVAFNSQVLFRRASGCADEPAHSLPQQLSCSCCKLTETSSPNVYMLPRSIGPGRKR